MEKSNPNLCHRQILASDLQRHGFSPCIMDLPLPSQYPEVVWALHSLKIAVFVIVKFQKCNVISLPPNHMLKQEGLMLKQEVYLWVVQKTGCGKVKYYYHVFSFSTLTDCSKNKLCQFS